MVACRVLTNRSVIRFQKLREQAMKDVAKRIAPYQQVIEGYGYR